MLDELKTLRNQIKGKKRKLTSADLRREQMELFDRLPPEVRDAINYSKQGWTVNSFRQIAAVVRALGPSKTAAMIKGEKL